MIGRYRVLFAGFVLVGLGVRRILRDLDVLLRELEEAVR